MTCCRTGNCWEGKRNQTTALFHVSAAWQPSSLVI